MSIKKINKNGQVQWKIYLPKILKKEINFYPLKQWLVHYLAANMVVLNI